MGKLKNIIKSRALWAFLGVVVGQYAPEVAPYINLIGGVVGA